MFLWALTAVTMSMCGYFAVTFPLAEGRISSIIERQCGDSPPLNWISRIELSDSMNPRDLVKISFEAEGGQAAEVLETFRSSSNVQVGDVAQVRYRESDPSFAFRADRIWLLPLGALLVSIALSLIPLFGSGGRGDLTE